MKHVIAFVSVLALIGWATPSAILAEEGGGAAAITTISGNLAKVEETKITVTRKGDAGEKTEVIALGELTKYFTETGNMETITGEGGAQIQRPELTEIGSQDLESGQQVTVKIKANVATEVIIHKAKPAPAAGGEEKK